jgi:hypothetical protein
VNEFLGTDKKTLHGKEMCQIVVVKAPLCVVRLTFAVRGVSNLYIEVLNCGITRNTLVVDCECGGVLQTVICRIVTYLQIATYRGLKLTFSLCSTDVNLPGIGHSAEILRVIDTNKKLKHSARRPENQPTGHECDPPGGQALCWRDMAAMPD